MKSDAFVRICNNIYTVCLNERVWEIPDRYSQHVKYLQFQKTIEIGMRRRKKLVDEYRKYAFINEYCDKPYTEQILANQRRWKTVVRSFQIDDEGNRILDKKLILPYHQEHLPARDLFLVRFPGIIESTFYYIEVVHVDSLEKKLDIIHSSQCF